MELKEEKKFCNKHKIYYISKSIFYMSSNCPKCSEDEEKEENYKKEKEYLDKFEKKLNICGISPRFQNKNINDFYRKNDNYDNIILFFNEYIKDIDLTIKNITNAIFTGPSQSGKSHIANSIAIEFVKNKKTVSIITISDLIREIRETWNVTNKIKESTIIKEFALKDLLIIDKIGKQYGTDNEKQLIEEVFNMRYDMKKMSILISELNIKEIKNYIPKEIILKLKEDNLKIIKF